MSVLRPLFVVALATVAAAIPGFGTGDARAADPAVRVTFVESCPAGGAPGDVPVTAIGLEAPAVAAAGPAHVVVLVDTSASQTGVFRQQALDAVAGLLEAARPEDRFALATVDVACTPAVAGFHPADSDAMRAAARGLDSKTPLGSTDLFAALDSAVAMLGDRQGTLAVVYVGDGPALGGVEADEFGRAIDALRAKRIAVSSIGAGPQVNVPCLASLAGATGGMLFVLGEDDAAKAAGARIGGQAVQPVYWPDVVTVVTAAADVEPRMLPARLPPLRSDRDAVVLVEGKLADARIEVTLRHADGRPHNLAIPVPAATPRDENAYIAELARNARSTDGIFLPLLDRSSLDVAREVIRGEAAALAALSRQAEAAGVPDSARRLAEASLRRDPDNPEAALMRDVSQRRAAPPGSARPAPVASPAAPDQPSDLGQVQAMRRVRGQQLERETAVRIRDARNLLATNPDRARDILKEVQVEVDRSDDLDAADKARLLRELEMRIRESIVRSREKMDRDIAAERRAAAGRDRMRVNDELQRRENRIKQLTERYNALVEAGIRDGYAQPEMYPAVIDGEAVIGFESPTKALVEAERVVGEEIAKEAPDLWAGYPIPMTARVVGRTAPLVARIMDYDAENVRTRRDQERGFMDQLHLVDVAAIPFPDEPPIVYPTAERWREISRLREKYKSVDLANPTKNEKRIYESLEKEVSRTFDFQETPLRAVISQLQDEFNIQIVPDMQALTDAGIDLDATTVTQKLQGVSLRSALRLLLREPGLTYVIKDEVLLITTKEKAQENLVVKVYPVADLVLPVNPSSGLNPFQTGGGLGGQNSINSGMGVGNGGGMGGGMGGGGMGGQFCWVARAVYGAHDPRWLVFRDWMTAEAPHWLRSAYATQGPDLADWLRARPVARFALRMAMDAIVEPRLRIVAAGGQFQVADAKARLAREASATAEPGTASADAEDRIGLPTDVLNADDLGSAVVAYLAGPAAKNVAGAPTADSRADALRMAQVRVSAADLGRTQRFDRAVELISAVISCGRGEPWMYESLAIALEAAGRPREEIERTLMSSADFATSPVELLQLATYLARFGFDRQAVRVCRRVVRIDPANREAFALAMTLASRSDDKAALRWACAGVLAHEWPAAQRSVASRAALLAKATIEALEQAGQADDAAAFRAEVDAALVRDLVLELTWSGDADIDLVVEEPSGSVCSPAAPRSAAGGVLLTETDAAGGVHRERYVVAEAFPGTYRALVRRACGKVEADTVTAETIIRRGTDGEQRQKKQIRLGADESLIVVNLGSGRRREPLLDAQIAQDVALQRQVGQTVLAQQFAPIGDPLAWAAIAANRVDVGGAPVAAQQLATIADPQAAAAIAASRAGTGGAPVPGLPFFRNGAVGYQPIVTTLPEGVNMFARAVVSADRRYVRITATPLFSSVGQVTTFNWESGNTQNVTNQAAGQGGFQGQGGVPGGQQAAGQQVGQQALGQQAAGQQAVGQQAAGQQAAGQQALGQAAGVAVGVGVGNVGPAVCWVAREVYGVDDPRWLVFRGWLLAEAPDWLRDAYIARGAAFAGWLHDKPAARAAVRAAMDRVVAGRTAAPAAP